MPRVIRIGQPQRKSFSKEGLWGRMAIETKVERGLRWLIVMDAPIRRARLVEGEDVKITETTTSGGAPYPVGRAAAIFLRAGRDRLGFSAKSVEQDLETIVAQAGW